MRIIHVGDFCIVSVVVALAIGISLASLAAKSLFHPAKHFSSLSLQAGDQPTTNNEIFQCNQPKAQMPGDSSSKHSVTLSWKASVSLSAPPVRGEGYNLYRLNPDGSCTKINGALIGVTVYEDRFVELGKTYRYATKAVKQDSETGSSNVVEVTIPPT
jgi:hypothetical protein